MAKSSQGPACASVYIDTHSSTQPPPHHLHTNTNTHTHTHIHTHTLTLHIHAESHSAPLRYPIMPQNFDPTGSEWDDLHAAKSICPPELNPAPRVKWWFPAL